MTEESFVRNTTKCCFKDIPHFNKKYIIKKLLTMLICIWISVGENVMYVHACGTSQILKTQHQITRATQLHQNWNQGVMPVPICFWLLQVFLHVFIPSLQSDIFFQSFEIYKRILSHGWQSFSVLGSPLFSLFSYYINTTIDLPSGLQIQKFFYFIGPMSTTMFAEDHYWTVITPTGDSSLSLLYV
jgi:hypothetical protein